MRRRSVIRTALLVVTLCFNAPAAHSQIAATDAAAARDAIARLLPLHDAQPLASNARFAADRNALLDFYRSVGASAVWAGDGYVLARQALVRLQQAGEHGLAPSDYAVPEPLPMGAHDGPEQRARFDLQLTAAMLRFLSDLHKGRTPPEIGWHGSVLQADHFDPAELLRTVVVQGNLDQAIATAEPVNPLYQRVKRTLAQYRQLEPHYQRLAPLPPLPGGIKLRPGVPYEGTAALHERLALLGDMPANAGHTGGGLFSDELAAGVQNFQKRHGLEQDGIPGPATMAALAVPLSHRILQLELTMERLRWIPALPPGPLVLVNIPAYRLWALDTRERPAAILAEMRVIVGKAARTPTPLFIGHLRHLEFNPVWNVPRGIALNEIIPRLAREPGYLTEQDMELVRQNGDIYSGNGAPRDLLQAGTVRIRQRAGSRNVLGAVKFAMPNPMNIYLHATSAGELFTRRQRDLSHGCIRLEQPAELAEFVLRGMPGWDRASVQQAMQPGPTRVVPLTSPVPVILFYATAATDRQGTPMFLRDIYGLDHNLARDLGAARAAYPLASAWGPQAGFSGFDRRHSGAQTWR